MGCVHLYALLDHQQGGRLWAGTWRLYDGNRNSADYDVLAPDGRKLGDVRRDLAARMTALRNQDATYTKLREITLGWDAPPGVSRWFGGARAARLQLSGRNLYWWTKFRGGDPEAENFFGGFELYQLQRNRELAAYPASRSGLGHREAGVLNMRTPILPDARRVHARSSADFIVMMAVTACREVTVGNYNAANLEQLTQAPTAKVVNGAVLGCSLVRAPTFRTTRATWACSVVRTSCSTPATRASSRWLNGPLTQIQDQGDFGWTAAYRQLRSGFTILDVVDGVLSYSPAQKEGVRGVVKTFIAMAYIDQLRVRDTFGLVLDIDVRGPGDLSVRVA